MDGSDAGPPSSGEAPLEDPPRRDSPWGAATATTPETLRGEGAAAFDALTETVLGEGAAPAASRVGGGGGTRWGASDPYAACDDGPAPIVDEPTPAGSEAVLTP